MWCEVIELTDWPPPMRSRWREVAGYITRQRPCWISYCTLNYHSVFFFTYTANTESGVSLQLKIRNRRKNDTNSRIYPQQKTCFLHPEDNDNINVPMIYWPKLESAGVVTRFQTIVTFFFLPVFCSYFLNTFNLFLSFPSFLFLLLLPHTIWDIIWAQFQLHKLVYTKSKWFKDWRLLGSSAVSTVR